MSHHHWQPTPRYSVFAHTLRQRVRVLYDRDVLVLQLFEAGAARLVTGLWIRRLRHVCGSRWDWRGQLTVVLIGEDGGKKLRQTTRIDLGEILALIDTMPMRHKYCALQ